MYSVNHFTDESFATNLRLGVIQIIRDTLRGGGSTKCHTKPSTTHNTISNAIDSVLKPETTKTERTHGGSEKGQKSVPYYLNGPL